ncbi:hypothetical protein AVV30_gp109 [Vibrio phage phi 1]|uniref:Uncharacterized protein n=1 Tax=Vibrio phage phi 1 TaxID=1589297 RepID=A0A0B5H2Q9_9CAUD|nr:hypothetical protein AVV30_gp109 [Vibrio phage phi 1]AJF40767.1 hypothetical protein SBVP1_0109 [Vibrio phage phi 1]
MKHLIAALTLTLTTLFSVFTTLLECIGLLSTSAKNVAHVVEDASNTFRMEEKLLNADKIKKLQQELNAKEIEL